jgi:isoleucyl-tRNA synthetase
VVVASDAERAAIERLAEVVASELNVKELDFVHTEAELVSYRVRPNYRSLGPRFGQKMPEVAAAVEALDAAKVAQHLQSGAEVGIAIDGKEHSLSREDVNLVMEPLEGYQVEAEAGHAVALELDLDDELRREGLAREIVRAVQEARKQAGLDVSDRIQLALGGDDELLAAAREHEAYIAGETLATSVGYGADGAGEKATIEGRELRIGLSRA